MLSWPLWKHYTMRCRGQMKWKIPMHLADIGQPYHIWCKFSTNDLVDIGMRARQRPLFPRHTHKLDWQWLLLCWVELGLLVHIVSLFPSHQHDLLIYLKLLQLQIYDGWIGCSTVTNVVAAASVLKIIQKFLVDKCLFGHNQRCHHKLFKWNLICIAYLFMPSHWMSICAYSNGK